MYDLHSEFDLDQHKQHFINYLEVIVEPNGHVCYAVPSHQRFLELYGARQRGMSVDEFADTCPNDMWADYQNWLLDQTGCVSVWSIGFMTPPNTTPAQQKVLDAFVAAKVMGNKQLNWRKDQ